MALQTSASLQRCHSNFWIHLSLGYRKIQEMTFPQANSTKPCSAAVCANAENQKTILSKTVQLFQPYFSWRAKCHENALKESTELQCSPHSEDTEILTCTRSLKSKNAANPEGLTCTDASRDPESTVTSGCTEPCVLYAQDPEQYLLHIQQQVSGGCRSLSVGRGLSDSSVPPLEPSLEPSASSVPPLEPSLGPSASSVPPLEPSASSVPQLEPSLVPDLSFPLCFCHSPFVMLLRHTLSPDAFVEMCAHLLDNNMAHQLLRSVYVMAECGCLVWAR